MNPMVIMKVRLFVIFTLIILMRKEYLNLFGEIKVIIDNNPSKSIRSLACDIGASEFHIRQLVHEDIRYFSYKIKKGQFLSQAMKDKRKDSALKFFNKLKHILQPNIPWFFSDEKIFCPDQMMNS